MSCVGASQKNRFLAYGEQLHSRFVALERIGSGGFGQIFRGVDSANDVKVAIKVEDTFSEKSTHDPRRLVVEHRVLAELRGKRHFPLLLATGKSLRGCPFIIMELLGENLAVLRRHVPNKCFSNSTLFHVAQQVTIALESLHKLNYIHRDIKPANCCVGHHGEAARTIYLIDFGMCRKMVNQKGEWRTPRSDAGFCGTIRFASARAIRRKECGAVDDLIGLIYALIELGTGELPWRREDDMAAVLKMKREIKSADLCRKLPGPMTDCFDYLRTLNYDDKVCYGRIQEFLRSCLPEGFSYEDPFDWEPATKKKSPETKKAPKKKTSEEGEEAKKSSKDTKRKTKPDATVAADVCLVSAREDSGD